MGHFAIPPSGNTNADYHVDNQMCVGSVGRMIVPPGGSAEIVLCAADTLDVRSNNPNVIPNPIPERLGHGGRILTIAPKAPTGGSYIDFGVLNDDGWSWAPGSPWPGHLLVNVEPRAEKPVADGLIKLEAPSLALNAAHTPVVYTLAANRTVSPGTPNETVMAMVASQGKLKHLVFSCHGYVAHSKETKTITDSTIDIGKGLNKANVEMFSRLKSMSGGVIWAGACAIGNDNETNKLRAQNSGCYFVAPIMFMSPKNAAARRPPPNIIDMYRRFYPKVYAPSGNLISWDTFVKGYTGKLGFKIVAG